MQNGSLFTQNARNWYYFFGFLGNFYYQFEEYFESKMWNRSTLFLFVLIINRAVLGNHIWKPILEELKSRSIIFETLNQKPVHVIYIQPNAYHLVYNPVSILLYKF